MASQAMAPSSVRAVLKIVSPALFSFLADNFGLAVILPLIAIRSQFLIEKVDVAAGLGGWATRGGGANATATACAVPAGAAGCPTVAFDVESDAYSWPAASACLCSEESCARAASRARIGSASS